MIENRMENKTGHFNCYEFYVCTMSGLITLVFNLVQ